MLVFFFQTITDALTPQEKKFCSLSSLVMMPPDASKLSTKETWTARKIVLAQVQRYHRLHGPSVASK